MAIVPNLVERAAFAGQVAPAMLLDVLGAGTLRLVHAGLRLGLFEALRQGPLPAGEVARRLGTDPRGTALLLDTLVACGYVQRRRGGYANSRLTTRWLLRGQVGSMDRLVTFWEEVVFPYWNDQLETAVRQGKPAETIYAWMDRHTGTWPQAQGWFAQLAEAAAPEVVRRAPLPAGARALLDVGGGHGGYSAAYCKAHPGLRATVLDLPQPLRAAEETVAREGLRDRMALRSADYTRDDLGSGFDAALVFNIVHGHLPAENLALLRRVHAALRPGGRVLVLEQLRGLAPGPAVRAMVEVVGFNYFAVLGGQAYARPEVEGWLRQAGFARPKALALRSSPGNTLLVAAKP